MDLKKTLQSKTFRGVATGFGVVTAGLLLFAGGMAVGSRKEEFACKWDENYRHNFGDHVGMMTPPPPGTMPFQGHMVGVHGILGNVVSVMDDSIVVQGKDGVERGVIVTDVTPIRFGGAQVTQEALKAGQTVMTFGDPDDSGRIQARFIRILQ